MPSTRLSMGELADRILAGNKRATAQAISLVENGRPAVEDLMRRLYPHTGNAFTLGFTGPPGAGKSTLVDDVVQILRGQDQEVAVVAVDPNSPFSGGAILGDRIRMMRHAMDRSVFIRSMGARGRLGGLAPATSRAVQIFDAYGADYVVLETVGVGQSELEVAELADTTVVVLMPGLGDGVQAIKAGILEIADVFVVNKADHPDVQRTLADLRELLRADVGRREWIPPIIRTVATREEGLDDLWAALDKHRRYLETSGELERRRRARLEREIVDIAITKLRQRVLEPSTATAEFREILQQVEQRRVDPYSAAHTLLSDTSVSDAAEPVAALQTSEA